MIFWRSVPDFYLGKNEDEIPDYEKGTYDLIKKIIDKFGGNKFKKSGIRYNPNEYYDLNAYEAEIKSWNPPQEMILMTKGSKPIYLGTAIKLLKSQYKKSQKRKRRRLV